MPKRVTSTGEYLRQASRRAWVAWREGRLDLSPRIVARHLRNLRHELESGPVPSAAAAPPANKREVLEAACRTALQELLRTDARLAFASPSSPAVSVVLVLFNRAELTLRCLRSLAAIRTPSLELIVVDNASSDETPALLRRIDGARILINARNEGFLRAMNQAAQVARGRTMLLLNNDAELLPGSLAAALATLDAEPNAGAVVGRLVFPEGRLQEAGSIIWQDGSCLGYGRGDDPQAPPYQFRRDVDYGSGAFLLTPLAVWRELGGFDELFAPAYYEDADYCARLWRSGRRVIYDPRAVAVHFEFASSRSRSEAIALQTERRERFVRKHREWLRTQLPARPEWALSARSAGKKPRILVLDDRVPHVWLGAGFPRANALLRALEELGWQVTLLPLSFWKEEWDAVREDVPATVEVMTGVGPERLGEHLLQRAGFYDAILVSRPHNMQRLLAALARTPMAAPIIYDAEAIFAEREEVERALRGKSRSPEAREAAIAEEVALAAKAAAVLAVSPHDAEHFLRAGHRTFRVGHAIAPTPATAGFEQRSGLLFVGALQEPGSPNVDSLEWLVRNVLPHLPHSMGLDVIGASTLDEVLRLRSSRTHLLGRVDDLRAAYEKARVFAAPTRFAAGVPYKVHHAAAHGVPVVCTSLIARQLGWAHERELLVADEAIAFAEAIRRLHEDRDLWVRIHDGALRRVAEDCSPEAFADGLRSALSLVAPEAAKRAQAGPNWPRR